MPIDSLSVSCLGISDLTFNSKNIGRRELAIKLKGDCIHSKALSLYIRLTFLLALNVNNPGTCCSNAKYYDHAKSYIPYII